MTIAPGTLIAGKYLLDRQIIRPSRRLARDRGAAWVARQGQLGTPVAVKLLDAACAAWPGYLPRHQRELRAAATLGTRHVARVLDHGVEGDTLYVVTELLLGEDLETRLLRCGRLPPQEAVRLLAQAGEALRCAEEAGLVHRDLRPERLFFAFERGEEIVKVLDFALAEELPPTLGQGAATASDVAAALHYLSPEQIRAEGPPDALTDLWSLGALLFRALTGRLPFPGDLPGVVVSQILLAPVPRATHAVPGLPDALDAFFDKALARDPLCRFRSAAEMLEAFTRIAGVAPALSSGARARALVGRGARLHLAARVAPPASAAPPAPPNAEAPAASAALPAMAPALPEATPPPSVMDVPRRPPIVVLPAMTAQPPPSSAAPLVRSAPETQLTAAAPDLPELGPCPARGRRRTFPLGALAVVGAFLALTTLRLAGDAPGAPSASAPARTFAAAASERAAVVVLRDPLAPLVTAAAARIAAAATATAAPVAAAVSPAPPAPPSPRPAALPRGPSGKRSLRR